MDVLNGVNAVIVNAKKHTVNKIGTIRRVNDVTIKIAPTKSSNTAVKRKQ